MTSEFSSVSYLFRSVVTACGMHVQTMQDPGARTQMETKMKAMKEDPELKHIIEELETGGPAAMMKCAPS